MSLTGNDYHELRMLALDWATSHATPGEDPASVLARADVYLRYVIEPLRPDVKEGVAKAAGATKH